MAVELIWASDRLALFNKLDQLNEGETLPVRHTLWFLMSGIIKEGNVYVDQWPNFKSVCCLFPSKLYAPKSDQDFVVITTKDNNDNYAKFLNELATIRRWRQREGIIIEYLNAQLTEITSNILCPTNTDGQVWSSEPFRLYPLVKPENLEKYSQQIAAAQSKWEQEGFTYGNMSANEVQLVEDAYNYDVPNHKELYTWLIDTFPSLCVRDDQGEVAGCSISYSYGAGGALLVVPKYRGKGGIIIGGGRICLDLAKISPCQTFVRILDSNIRSRKHMGKYYFDMIESDVFVVWLAFTPASYSYQRSRL